MKGGSAAERNLKLFEGPFGSLYSLYMGHQRISRPIARLVWGSDTRHFYASMQAIRDVPGGGTVVDAPCGAGVAFSELEPDQRVRYLAFDLSPRMVERARRLARKRGLKQVEVGVANAANLPLPDESADLLLSYFGLHCFDAPEAALREANRVLQPGGRLVGSSIVRGDRRLDRLRVVPGRGGFGKVATEAELLEWIGGAGFERIGIETRGVFSVFQARR